MSQHGQFLFFLAPQGHKEQLLKEISLKFKGLTLNYTNEEFLTFKNQTNEFSLDHLSKIALKHCKILGLCLGPFDRAQENEVIEDFLTDYQISSYTIQRWSLKKELPFGDTPILNNFVFDIIELSEDRCWIGIHIHSNF
ncbi:hypothetical protein A9Q84_09675 [Halobacteriovorax marinus]|uniref:Uncharacterized protein n=1 Tax=Halobacteriovorax marinus TaxID=97084 RepID=A0A1Y5F783_9BACT|nr:hypothetical protein A9Q84_09675 [Halobacteriovorax marinus]